MFGATPQMVMGWGSIDLVNDGRNVYDNVQFDLSLSRHPHHDLLGR